VITPRPLGRGRGRRYKRQQTGWSAGAGGAGWPTGAAGAGGATGRSFGCTGSGGRTARRGGQAAGSAGLGVNMRGTSPASPAHRRRAIPPTCLGGRGRRLHVDLERHHVDQLGCRTRSDWANGAGGATGLQGPQGAPGPTGPVGRQARG
jgi:hypothetical protein